MLEINRNPAILLHFRVLIQFAAGKGRFRFGKPLQTASNPMPSEAVSVVQYAPLPRTDTAVGELMMFQHTGRHIKHRPMRCPGSEGLHPFQI
ncbi:hypothetical protein GVX55_09270 [Neisseria meningitidis]|nr:hypothetical protein [Neisseria meningitidis]MBG8648794.1 hypothetical protein [Neisseria meningitidis]MBG8738246.1 hypothetical protein [Neisseria meningitidis]MBG9014981.1 hypothetical protein [Neisseria meningitidis]MBG9097887.1 hypothetical protein [Neisseria meningitidis]